MTNKIKGFVYIMGNNINTDDIVPSHALTMRCAEDMAQCACETIDPQFAENVQKREIIVAGENFGCGSSREEAVHVFKVLGIKAIIAKSFARIYFRNLINNGIPAITLDWKPNDFQKEDKLRIDLEKGLIMNSSTQTTLHFQKLPSFLMNIIDKGGILNVIKEDLSAS